MLRAGLTPFGLLKFRWASWVSHCLYLVSYAEALFLNYSHTSSGNKDHCLHCNNLGWDLRHSCWSHSWIRTFQPTWGRISPLTNILSACASKNDAENSSLCLCCFNQMKSSKTCLKFWGIFLVYTRLLSWQLWHIRYFPKYLKWFAICGNYSFIQLTGFKTEARGQPDPTTKYTK